jgi:hypothetical protein
MSLTSFAARDPSIRPLERTIVAGAMAAVRPSRLALLLLLASCLHARLAAADAANRNLLPFGERAAFLGNAGITSQTGDAVFYNPANLARIGHPNLSVSANVYAVVDLKAEPLLEIEGVDQPFEASGFLSIPSTLVSTYHFGGWSIATAVLVPDSVTLKNRVTFDSPSLHVTLLQEQAQESLYLGGGVAHVIVPGLTAGASVFVAKESTADLTFLRSEVASTEPSMVSEFTSNTDATVFNLTAVVGLSWQPTPTLGIGLRTQVPPIRLTGDADIYQSVNVPGDAANTVESAWEDADQRAPLPWDVGLGVSFRPHPKLELLADLNLELPATLTVRDDPDLPPDVGFAQTKTRVAPRFGAGAEWQFLSQIWLRLGALYNGSAYATPKTSDDEVSEQYYGVTGGLAWQKDRTHTAIGGFYLRSDADVIVQGSDPPRLSDARTVVYGALLTVSYRL